MDGRMGLLAHTRGRKLEQRAGAKCQKRIGVSVCEKLDRVLLPFDTFI